MNIIVGTYDSCKSLILGNVRVIFTKTAPTRPYTYCAIIVHSRYYWQCRMYIERASVRYIEKIKRGLKFIAKFVTILLYVMILSKLAFVRLWWTAFVFIFCDMKSNDWIVSKIYLFLRYFRISSIHKRKELMKSALIEERIKLYRDLRALWTTEPNNRFRLHIIRTSVKRNKTLTTWPGIARRWAREKIMSSRNIETFRANGNRTNYRRLLLMGEHLARRYLH